MAAARWRTYLTAGVLRLTLVLGSFRLVFGDHGLVLVHAAVCLRHGVRFAGQSVLHCTLVVRDHTRHHRRHLRE